MKSFAQVINSFGLGNATEDLQLSFAAMVLGLLAAQQTTEEAVKASIDTLVTDLGAVPEASDELADAEAIQTTLSGLTTAGTTNYFQQALNALSSYRGTPAYAYMKYLLEDKAQKFGS